MSDRNSLARRYTLPHAQTADCIQYRDRDRDWGWSLYVRSLLSKDETALYYTSLIRNSYILVTSLVAVQEISHVRVSQKVTQPSIDRPPWRWRRAAPHHRPATSKQHT